MLDGPAMASKVIGAAVLIVRLRENLAKCERELARWDAHERDPEHVKAPMLRREVLEATRDMLLDELRRASGDPKPV